MEGSQREYKLELGSKPKSGVYSFLKDVVAFLNTSGGEIIFGVDDNGNEVGIKPDIYDDTYEKIKNLIFDCVCPMNIEEFDFIEMENNCIKIIVSNITKHKPYYLKRYGRVPEGVYIRKGPSSIKLDQYKIDMMYKVHNTKSLANSLATHQKFEFEILSKRYKFQKDRELSDIKMLNLKLLNDDEKITKLGELFADENATDISFSKFEGNDKASRLIYTINYGEVPLFETFEK